MKKQFLTIRLNRFLVEFCCAWGILLFLGLCLPPNLPAFDFSTWYHGASDYDLALQEAMDANKPLIVYFHTDWCPWCKKLNHDYLSSYEMEQFLQDIPKVEINPDKGSAEKALQAKYGVKGYPTFFVYLPSFEKNPGAGLYPFRTTGNWTVDEFIQAIQKKIANGYDVKGYTSLKNKAYEDALGYFEQATDIDSEDAYAYFMMGLVYYNRAFVEKNTDLFAEAEEDYNKALEIDPNYTECEKDLEKLHDTMKKMGLTTGN